MGSVTVTVADPEKNAGSATVDFVVNQPAPTPGKILLASANQARPGETISAFSAFQRLAAAVKTGGGSCPMYHTYSGVNIPAFGGTAGPLNISNKLLTMLNIKTPGQDYAGAAAGKYDGLLNSLLSGWLSAYNASGIVGWRGELTIDHEAEQPGKNNNAENTFAVAFTKAFAHYVTVFLAHPASAFITLNYVGMSYSYTSDAISKGRKIALWDPWPLLTADQRTKVRYATDMYFKAEKSIDTNWNVYALPYLNYATGRRKAIFECGVNNDAGASDAVMSKLITDLGPKLKASGFETIAYYESQGPAAGTAPWIDTPAKAKALASWST